MEWIRRAPSKAVIFVTFVAFYFRELIVSACRIAWDVVTIRDYSRPGIIEVPLDAKTDLEIAVVSNLITFSPGTMVVNLSSDRKKLGVHVVFLDDPQALISEIKSKLEARVLEVLR